MYTKSTKDLKLSIVDVESIYDVCIVLDDDTERNPFEVIKVRPLSQWSSLFLKINEETEDEHESRDLDERTDNTNTTLYDESDDEGYMI